MHNVMYNIHACPKKSLKGEFPKSQAGLSSSSPLSLNGFWDSQMRGWTFCEAAKGGSKLSYLKGGHQAWVHLDQMVLVMARREAGPCEKQPKTLNEELENNSRKPRDPVKNRHSDSLKKGHLLFTRVR